MDKSFAISGSLLRAFFHEEGAKEYTDKSFAISDILLCAFSHGISGEYEENPQ